MHVSLPGTPFHQFYNGCNYLSMSGLKLIRVSKRAPVIYGYLSLKGFGWNV